MDIATRQGVEKAPELNGRRDVNQQHQKKGNMANSECERGT